MEAFLGRGLPLDASGSRMSGVPISWLRENFGVCSEDANGHTVSFYCRAWILHLFGRVLFLDVTGETASSFYVYIHCIR